MSETAYSPDGLPLVVEQRPLSSAAAERRVETVFDHGGNPVRTDTMVSASRTDTSTMAWFADGLRRESSTTVTGHNAGAVTWRWGYDRAGNTTHTWSPSAVAGAANNTAGAPTVLGYSSDGLVTEMVEPVRADGGQQRETGFGHDPLGRVVQETVALVGASPAVSPPRSYSWTTLGQPASETGRDGAVQSFTYDAAGQLTSATEDVHGTVVEAGYYLNGWLRDTVSHRAGETSRFQKFQYWGDGLEGWRWFADDAAFSQNANIQGYGYNDARALTVVAPAGWSFDFESWNITNDRAGRPVSVTDPPTGSGAARATVLDRNPDGTVAQQTVHAGAAGTAVIDEWDYTYDSTGRVASKARSGGAGTVSEVYGYDEAGRLATVNAGQISYDPNGNRLSGPGMPTLTFRADNSIATGPDETGSGSEAYQYAPWGGLTRDACRSYSYDGFDRSRTTTIRKRALDLLPRCELVEDLAGANDEKRYDALGRNTWARHDRLNLAGVVADTDYVHLHHVGLGQDVVWEHTLGAPARSGRYVNTPGGTPLAVVDGNNEREFLHRDGQNDTVLAVDDDGQVECAPNIDSWGASDTDCDDPLLPESANRKWYNSSRLDPATDTYQWGARTYNPETATWQQPDTPALSGAPDQVSIGTDPLVANRYAYVNGDPINLADPAGHEPCPKSGCTGRERIPRSDWSPAQHEAEAEAHGYTGPTFDELVAGWTPTDSVVGRYEACVNRVGGTSDLGKFLAGRSDECAALAPSAEYKHARKQCRYAEYQCMVAAFLDQGYSPDRTYAIQAYYCRGPGDNFSGTGCDSGGVTDADEFFVVAELAVTLGASGVKSALRHGISRSIAPRAASGAESAAQGARLTEHLRLTERYGAGGVRELADGRIRYYGGLAQAAKPGEMAGARLVREWNPATGQSRTWYETLDQAGQVRIVHPKQPDIPWHYWFDEAGNYGGRR